MWALSCIGMDFRLPLQLTWEQKKAESFSPQLIQGFWQKLKKTFPRLLWCPRLSRRTTSTRKKWYSIDNIKFFAENTFLFWDQDQERFGGWKRCNISRKVPLPMNLLRGEKPKLILHNLAIFCVHWSFMPASRERVVPTEWQVRTVLGGCVSRAKVLPGLCPSECTRASRIDPRSENFTSATRTGRSTGSLQENLTADVHCAINKFESLGSGKQLILHGNPSAIAKGFFSVYGSPPTSFFAECALPMLSSVAILISLQPAVNPLPGCSSENQFMTNWREGLSWWPNSTRSTPHLTRVTGQWLCSGRKTRDASFDWFTTPENEGGDETSAPSPPRFIFFDDPSASWTSWTSRFAWTTTRIAPSSSTCWWERKRKSRKCVAWAITTNINEWQWWWSVTTGWERTATVCILLHMHQESRRYQCRKRHQYHQYSQWLFKSRSQYLMKILVALKTTKIQIARTSTCTCTDIFRWWVSSCGTTKSSEWPFKVATRKESPQRQKGKQTLPKWRSRVICQRQRSRSSWTQTKTMMCRKKNLERFQTRSRQYQCYLSRINIQFTRSIDQYYFDQFTKNIDQFQLWRWIRWQRWRSRRRRIWPSNTKCTKSGFRKNSAPSRHLRSHQWWALDNDARSTQVCSSSRVILFRGYGKRRTTGYMYNLTTIPSVQRSLCVEEVTDDSSSTRVELQCGVDNQTRDMLERCMATRGKAAGARAKWNRVHEKKRQPRKYEDTTSSLLNRNTLSGNPGLTMRFLTSLSWGSSNRRIVYDGSISPRRMRILQAMCWSYTGFWSRWCEEVQTRRIMWPRDGYLPSRPINKATSSEWRPDEYCEVSKIKQKYYLQTNSPAPTSKWQSYDVNRDVVCQLPPEAGHPPYIAASLKKLAYGHERCSQTPVEHSRRSTA